MQLKFRFQNTIRSDLLASCSLLFSAQNQIENDEEGWCKRSKYSWRISQWNLWIGLRQIVWGPEYDEVSPINLSRAPQKLQNKEGAGYKRGPAGFLTNKWSVGLYRLEAHVIRGVLQLAMSTVWVCLFRPFALLLFPYLLFFFFFFLHLHSHPSRLDNLDKNTYLSIDTRLHNLDKILPLSIKKVHAHKFDNPRKQFKVKSSWTSTKSGVK